MQILRAHEQQLIELLAESHVRFVIVGGLAVHHYLPERGINDVDILLEPERENIKRFASALNRVGCVLEKEIVESLAEPKKQLHFGFPFPGCEIITSISNVSFEDAFSAGPSVNIGGYEVVLLSVEHLILSKGERGEQKDLDDIVKLREFL